MGGISYLVDVVSRSVPGLDTAEGEGPAPTTDSPRVVAETISPVDSATSEGAFFGPRIVNLPNGKSLGQGNVEFLIGHRPGVGEIETQPVGGDQRALLVDLLTQHRAEGKI